ncbi:MAG: elongation factor G [Chloroflexi bacterium]|nr:elongation factor G [Chloroflexota bacterium]MXY00418.1 elongation factor G [Chloroflexota bacterium]MYC47903.1 elongation factor G [Chloroflexota bacterium]
MKQYPTDHVRNVVLLAQKGNGKTTLAEAALYASGVTSRMGRVEDGNTLSDFQPEEVARHTSTALSVLACEWQGRKINIIDVPGDPEFGGEITSGIWAADCAVIMVDATAGIEVGTELAWLNASRADLPVVFALNRLDRENIDFAAVVSELGEAYGAVTPMQAPYGTGSAFAGVVDLIGESGFQFGERTSQSEAIPDALVEAAAADRAELVEAIASQNEDLIEQYLLDEEISAADLKSTLADAVAARELFPLYCISAVNNAGVDLLLAALAEIAPPPRARSDGADCAVAFKTIVDPQMGHQTYLRVCAGDVSGGHTLHNLSRSGDTRIGHVFAPIGREQQEVPGFAVGDILRAPKLSDTHTGDTLSADRNGDPLPGPKMPDPNMALAVSPESKADVDKLSTALHRLTEQDPSLQITREMETGETLLWGLGDSHLNIALEMIASKFGAKVEVSTPKVPYRETIRRPRVANGRYKRQSGGHGQFGDVTIVLEPLPLEEGEFEFVSEIVGGAISRSYIPAVEKGVVQAMSEGIRAKYPVVGCRVRLTDGKEHSVDSSDQAFQLAGAAAFRNAAAEAMPTILEPIHEVRITVPDNFTGAIIGDLNSKRGHIVGTDQGQDSQAVIIAEAPLAETQRYAVDLKQMTQGRGSFTSSFLRYQEMPQHLQKTVVDASNGSG